MQKTNFNEFQFKEYESILKNCVVENEELKVSEENLDSTIETLSTIIDYQKFLTLIGSNDTYKEFYLKNGTLVKVISKNGVINIAQKTAKGEIINLVLSRLSGKEVSDTLLKIAKDTKNK